MEDRRRSDDKNWQKFDEFMDESRIYRASDNIKQDYQIKAVDSLNTKVSIQNGRIAELEKWRNEIAIKIRDKKDNQVNVQTFISGAAAIIMAISAIIMIFKK